MRVLHHQGDLHAVVEREFSEYRRYVIFHGGDTEVQVRGEELAANWFGWFNRALEASAVPDDVPMWWRRYAFHGYLQLQKLDQRALEPHLPPALFYNLLLTARKPATPPAGR